MTNKKYLSEPALCGRARVTAIGLADKPWVRLDQTWLHPQGGGQKPDRGTIAGITVVHVAHADEGEVDHFLSEALHDVSVGDEVDVIIDSDWRLMNSKLHSGGHVIAALVEKGFPDVTAISGHHWPGEARIEFTATTFPSEEQLTIHLSTAIQGVIAKAVAIRVRSEVGETRVVQVGDYRAVPCGGTHVYNCSQLDALTVTDIKVKKGKLRVSYTA